MIGVPDNNVPSKGIPFSLQNNIASDTSIVVAIPCYNEEIAIGSIVLCAFKYANKVVVIDDGSDDKTAEIARYAGADVIAHEKNLGKGAGIREAFRYARGNNYEILILIDGDGQHDPDEIPLLVRPILDGNADMVNGSRFLVKGKNNIPKYRILGQNILNMATNKSCKTSITDSQNGFRAFSRSTFDSFSLMTNGMGIESEMLIDAAKAGLRVVEVPISVRYDVNGSTYNPILHGLRVLNTIMIRT